MSLELVKTGVDKEKSDAEWLMQANTLGIAYELNPAALSYALRRALPKVPKRLRKRYAQTAVHPKRESWASTFKRLGRGVKAIADMAAPVATVVAPGAGTAAATALTAVSPKVTKLVSNAYRGAPQAKMTLQQVAARANQGDPRARKVAKHVAIALRARKTLRSVALAARQGQPIAKQEAKAAAVVLRKGKTGGRWLVRTPEGREIEFGGWAWNVPYRQLAPRKRYMRSWYLRGLAA